MGEAAQRSTSERRMVTLTDFLRYVFLRDHPWEETSRTNPFGGPELNAMEAIVRRVVRVAMPSLFYLLP